MSILNIAHRGDSANHTENTLLAFQSAYDKGADGAELDLRWTRDHHIVIFHDTQLDRLTNGCGPLHRFTLKELQNLSFIGDEQASLLTLEDYLRWVVDKEFKTILELKVRTPLMEDCLLRLLDGYDKKEDVIISSCHPHHLESIKRREDVMQCAYVFDMHSLKAIGLSNSFMNLKSLFEYLHSWRIEYIHPHASLIDEDLLSLADIYHLKINTWTVNDSDQLKELCQRQLYGIMTDYPARLSQMMKEQSEPSSI